MPQPEIEMHFTEIMGLSRQLKELAKKITRYSEDELMQRIFEIKTGWNSACADILAKKEGEIVKDICKEAQRLNEMAVEMEEQAKKMYRCEKANSQIAVFRNY